MSSKITFLLLPNTNLLDLGGASQVFYEAIDQGLNFDINFCSSENNIETAMSLPLGKIANYKKQELNKGDYLIVLSADYKYIFSKEFNPPVLDISPSIFCGTYQKYCHALLSQK